ncbi:MAG: FHA domain-containing protein [Bacteriovoracaceae bacterium]
MKVTVLKNNQLISDLVLDTSDSTERYEIFIGRADDCHVIIDDPLVSRHHCVIKGEGGVWTCEKISQVGMLVVNGQSLPKSILTGADELRFGPYVVMIQDFLRAYTPPQPAPAAYILPKVEDLAPIEEMESLEETLEANPEEESLGNDSSLGDQGTDEDGFLNDETPAAEEANEESFVEETVDFNSGDEVTDDFGGGEGGESQESGGDEGTRFIQSFVNYELALFGEFAPYDRFLIDSPEVFIGRDPKKCQIILNDPEVSTVHAVIRKNMVEMTLEDLNSSNGTILNGQRINKSVISSGDEFVIGSTSFTVKVSSDLLDAEEDRLMPVEDGQYIETEEIVEEEVSLDDADGEEGFHTENATVEKSFIKRIWKDPVKRKKFLYGAVAIAVIMMLLPEEEKKPVVAEKPAETKLAEDPNAKKGPQLSPEEMKKLEIAYQMGFSKFEQREFQEALRYFNDVASIDPNFKKVQDMIKLSTEALRKIAELEKQRREEEERIKRKKEVEELLVKARSAVKDRQVVLAETLMGQIAEKDPENIEVQQLRLELDEWKKEQERIALEKAAKEAARKKMVDALQPGKTYYLNKEWYKSILKLEEFVAIKKMDEDLLKEANEMLREAKNQLATELGPIIGKARSLKEGQDLKGAYETYLDALKIEPTNAEALNEIDEIRNLLDTRSKRVYREAIIAESLSLFNDAKEKFQEVQQISPSDSEYYKKASEKLKNYLE